MRALARMRKAACRHFFEQKRALTSRRTVGHQPQSRPSREAFRDASPMDGRDMSAAAARDASPTPRGCASPGARADASPRAARDVTASSRGGRSGISQAERGARTRRKPRGRCTRFAKRPGPSERGESAGAEAQALRSGFAPPSACSRELPKRSRSHPRPSGARRQARAQASTGRGAWGLSGPWGKEPSARRRGSAGPSACLRGEGRRAG